MEVRRREYMTPEVQIALRAELTRDEGKKLFVYDDATGKPIVKGTTVIGNPSIGIGRNLAGRGITDAEADILLIDDMESVEEDLTPLIPWISSLSANRQCVVYSLYFNTSLGNPHHFVTSGWPRFLAQMQAGDFDGAAKNLETSKPWAIEVGARSGRLSNFVRNG
jgi:lysozyme